MQHLALFFLLAVTASMIFSFEVPVLAQEAPVEPSGEEMMEEEMTEEEMMEDEMTVEMMEDEVMEEMMEEIEEETVSSPLQQMTAGVDPHEIQCKTGQKLVFKASNWRPACVNESSFEILAARGWASSHDPSNDELIKMMDDYMMAHPEEIEEEETQDEIEIEEDMDIEGDTNLGNETEVVEPQNYEIELRESMDMGAQ